MSRRIGFQVVALAAFLILGLVSHGGAVPLQASVSGEIQRIVLSTPGDPWSGGFIVVGGETVIIPRNLLIDLPANRVTLKQLFDLAPAACLATGETGLAKGDVCNTTGTGGFATISANRTNAGDVIAGDVFIEKGREILTGTVTYINSTEGYFKVNGDALGVTGTMVRLNDPIGRHTVQSGLGCAAGSTGVNCSPDPRFTLDPDNYTNVFSSGYPVCIPTTADGLNDPNCPRTNRAAVPLPLTAEPPVADSSRFAPILVGDSLTTEGNFEIINGVQFLSVHTTMVGKALTSQTGQPNYLFLDEVEIDAPGFQNQRVRTLIIGYATGATIPPGGTTPTTDIVVYSIHRDPDLNEAHEFPLASVWGCDNAAGQGTCGAQGLGGAGNNIFKVRHDVDFLVPTDAKLDPCAHLRADPRFGTGICPLGGTPAEQFAILTPIPHEIIARTGTKLSNPDLAAFDIQGRPAQWGEYLFPFGLNLGGIAFPEMNEINLDLLAIPNIFEGIPWNLDRRLSPGGCLPTGCDAGPQPLDPFPFSGLDPRTQASLPTDAYNDPNYTAALLSTVRDRPLSYVTAVAPTAQRPDGFNFNGNSTVLSLALATDPPVQTVPAFAPVVLTCTQGVTGVPPVAGNDAASTAGVLTTFSLITNDTATLPAIIDPVSVLIQRAALNGTALANGDGTVSYTPNAGFVGVDSFTYTVKDTNVPPLESNVATAVVTVTAPAVNAPPVAVNDAVSTAGVLAAITVIANDTATPPATLDPASVLIQSVPLNGTATVVGGGVVNYLPNPGYVGIDSFTYIVSDTNVPPGQSNGATVVVNVSAATGNIPPVAANDIATAAGGLVTIPVAANDTDADGTVVAGSVTIQTLPINGTALANVAGPGTVNYVPNAGFVGTDSFTYIVLDNIGAQSNAATVTVTVNPPPNTAPVAGNDSATTALNTAVLISVLGNDSDPDVGGSLIPSSIQIGSLPANGTVLVNTATGTVTYTPAVNFAGADSFTYTVRDNLGAASNPATVTVNVTGGATEVITVTQAQFRVGNSQWTIRGTSSIPGPGNSVTFRVGPNFNGPTIGSDIVAAGGNFRLTVRRSVALPDGTNTISVQSSNGTLLLNVPVTVVP